MIYLSGKVLDCTDHIGVMLSFNVGKQRLTGHKVFAADNGCFAASEKYNDTKYLSWLKKLQKHYCLFAVAPDVVANAEATRKRAYPMLPKIRALGFKAAFVAQDGETINDIRWDNFDALFIGGSTNWKLSQPAAEIAQAAKARKKWVHMGRVNSFKRMRLAHVIGCDSVDGTFLAFEPTRRKHIIHQWIADINNQMTFELVS